MSKPKSTDRQKLRAYKLWATLKFGPTLIHEALQEEFTGKGTRKPVSIDTVKKWIADFKKLDINGDQPIEWHRIAEYGIPWEGSGKVIRMWKEYVTTLSPLHKSDRNESTLPTIRQVRWWWRVCNLVSPVLAEDAKKPQLIDCAIWGDNFASREVMNDVLGRQPYFDDLLAYLAFRPWASKDAREEYIEAVKQHLMPGLTKEDLILEFVDRVISGEDLDRAALDALPKISMKMEPDDYPLLPSEWMVYTPAVMAYAREKLHLKDRMDVRLLELLIRVKRLRLQGIDEGEIRKQIHELALLDSWEIDAENDNYVRYFPLNRDDVIEWVDRLVFDTDDDQEEVGK